MVNHWAIAIGINQYQFLQPLRYAQQDAQALRDFLVEEAGFPAEQCLLFTDTSSTRAERATYPTQGTLQAWIDDLCQQFVQPGDLVWCFFSGYGASYQGQDYLMPIDGDPSDISGTGISVRSLLQQFEATAAEIALVILDMNRTQGIQVDEPLSTQTLELARRLNIATILSCEPGEFSHEAANLHHGCFTAALLEGLRLGQCNTLADLDAFLRDRLPELTEHHWQPAQHPVVVVNPSEKRQQGILPRTLVTPAWDDFSYPAGTDTMAALDSDASRSSYSSPDERSPAGVGLSTLSVNPEQTNPGNTSNTSYASHSSPYKILSKLTNKPSASSGEPSKSNAQNPLGEPAAPEIPDSVFWRRFLVWGGLIAVFLCSGVIIRNLSAFTGRDTSIPVVSTSTQPTGFSQSTNATSPVVSPAVSPAPVRTATPSSAASPTASPDNSAASTPVPVAASNVPPDQLLPAAQAALQQQKSQEALRLLNQVPVNQQNAQYRNLKTQAEQRANQDLLEAARVTIRPNQASRFNQAIAQASKIKPGQPLYDQAQQDIQRWSQVILDLAEGRAKQGQFSEAIQTARLVPKNNAAVYGQAQQEIAQWQQKSQQQKANQAIINQAQGLLRRGEASSYSRAIASVRRIPSGQPGYLEAQRLAGEWSNIILGMAELRASRGRIQSALQTAALVPAGTPAYAQAQKAIADWKR
uniref:caspase family protein n=1 Tax=Trichocoleus desertorum TaxID=1481672 RepID=UPI0025B363CC|nr:caspase family protein [Trichocoleus desertorum]